MNPNPSFPERGPVLHLSKSRPVTDNQKILNRLALLVGLVSFGLPLVLIFGATIGGSCFRDSISHFYHAQFLGVMFTGLLFFIGGFLIAYSGTHPLETWGSSIAGVGAMGVALFPTTGSGCEPSGANEQYLSRVFAVVTNTGDKDAPYIAVEATNTDQSYFNLFGASADYHLVAAAIVFIYLGFFCLLVLRRVIPEIHGLGDTLVPTKRKRNRLYFWCGIVILACVAVLALKGPVLGDLDDWNSWNLTFWVEMLALWAFGLAWITKGRIFQRLNDL